MRTAQVYLCIWTRVFKGNLKGKSFRKTTSGSTFWPMTSWDSHVNLIRIIVLGKKLLPVVKGSDPIRVWLIAP